MKIFEIIATTGPGGAEALVSDLTIEFARAGATVKLFLLAGKRGDRGDLLHNRLAMTGVEVIGTEPRHPASMQNALWLARILSSWRPDAVHCHLYNAEVALTVSRLISGFVPSCYLRTIHNTDIVGTRSRLISRLLCYAFHYHVACSRSVADSYLYYLQNKGTGKLLTIPNGCRVAAESTNNAQRQKARNLLGIGAKDFVFCHVGAFRGAALAQSQKAQDTLLYAFAQKFAGEPSIRLVFAGDGPLKKDAEELARTLRVDKQVSFLGNIPESWPLYQASDVFVMPSRYEGLPIALIEAASTGIPIVASSIKEISSLHPGKGWWLFPVDNYNSLAEIMNDCRNRSQEKIFEANEGAVVIRQRHSIEKCSQAYMELFKHIVNSRTEQMHK